MKIYEYRVGYNYKRIEIRELDVEEKEKTYRIKSGYRNQIKKEEIDILIGYDGNLMYSLEDNKIDYYKKLLNDKFDKKILNYKASINVIEEQKNCLENSKVEHKEDKFTFF